MNKATKNVKKRPEQDGSTLKQIFSFADQLASKAKNNNKEAKQVLDSAYNAWYQVV